MEPSQDLSALQSRLAWESEHRPADGLTTEQVLDAVGQAGLSLTGRRQYLASKMQASYCAGGVTKDGIALSVCEYPSPTAARHGLRHMEQQFGAMTPHARRQARANVVLTIVQPPGVGSADMVSRALDTFQDLNHPQQE